MVPLCALEKLPAPMSVIDYALMQAGLYKMEDSDEATQVFLWLAKITKSWPQSHNSTAQTALIHSLKHLARMDDIHETFENHQLGREEEDPIITSQNALRYVLSQSNRGLLRSLYGVYEQQRRQWPLHTTCHHSDFLDMPHHKLQPWVASEEPGDERSADLRTWFDISQDEDAPTPNQVDSIGCTALHYKAVGQRVKVGANGTLDQYREAAALADLRGWIPLHYSCLFGLSNITTGLIHIGSDCNHQAKDGTTPLHCAAKAGHVEIVRRLIRYEAGVNVRDHFGYTPIFWAAFGGHVDIIKVLMTESKVRISSRFGRTLLHAVVIGNAIEAVKTVAGDTRCSELTEDALGATPFDLAMSLQNREIIHWFLSNKKFSGQILQRDPMKVLRQAISHGDSLAVDKILELWEAQTGVAPAYMDFTIEAIKAKQPTIALSLATHEDFPLSQQHEAGLLHLAVEHDQRDVIRYLIEVGLDIQAQDENKKGPIDYATMAANPDLVRFLVNELGVAINPHTFTLLVQSRNYLMARLFLTEFSFEVDTWAVTYMKFDDDPAMKSLLALYRKREEKNKAASLVSSDDKASSDTQLVSFDDRQSVNKAQWPNFDKISTEKEVVVEEPSDSQQDGLLGRS